MSAGITDTQRIEYIERKVRESYTGVSFETWKDGNERFFRMLRHHHGGQEKGTFRECIDSELLTELGTAALQRGR